MRTSILILAALLVGCTSSYEIEFKRPLGEIYYGTPLDDVKPINIGLSDKLAHLTETWTPPPFPAGFTFTDNSVSKESPKEHQAFVYQALQRIFTGGDRRLEYVSSDLQVFFTGSLNVEYDLSVSLDGKAMSAHRTVSDGTTYYEGIRRAVDMAIYDIYRQCQSSN